MQRPGSILSSLVDVAFPQSLNSAMCKVPQKTAGRTLRVCQLVALLWMDGILHHPRNPRIMISLCQQTMVLPGVKVARNGFRPSTVLPCTKPRRPQATPGAPQVQGLNGLLRPVGIGAFHCAVQAKPGGVLGTLGCRMVSFLVHWIGFHAK